MTETQKSTTEENFYEILGCTPTASYNELKSSYQKLIREYHPDKANNYEFDAYHNNNGSKDRFLLIDKAWKILRDNIRRKQYDADLLQNEGDHCLIYAELKKNQLNFDNNRDYTTYPCRCGSDFMIYKNFVEEIDECIIECFECSNCIKIK